MAIQALVMGFGGTGAHILTALKELTVIKQGKVPESIKFLLFDTIADWEPGKAVQIVGGAAEEKLAEGSERATSLDPATEYFYLGDHDPDLKTHVFGFLSPAGNPDKHPHLKDWLHASWLSKHIPRAKLGIAEGAAQQRQIGRFAMFQNSDRIQEKIRSLIRELAQHARGSSVNIWIIGSSAGGTGAGCLLDAAYLTHLAAGNTARIINGVIVLPDVYRGITGISESRAYSLLRELDRVQEQGIPERDRYTELDTTFSSRVSYDAHLQNVSMTENKLFDDLFYLGSECPDEKSRKKFFTSVANGIDPYLDESSGSKLLEASVNEMAAASSFGATRVYVPIETLAEIFAWEDVQYYLRGATASKENENEVVGLYSGSPNDRAANADSKVANLLALFGEILNRSERTANDNESYAKSVLDSKHIVTGWYEFSALSISSERMADGEAQSVGLTYINPYLSLLETDESKISTKDREVKTYKENRETKGIRESQEESRDRFASKLEEITLKYMSSAGGERSFEKGRRLVLEKMSSRLRSRIDSLVIDELNREATGVAADSTDPAQGTVLTRLYEEITHALKDGGPLMKIDKTIGQFIKALNQEKATRDHQTAEALRTLRSSRRAGMLDLGSWVETYQIAARSECAEYLRWYQKHMLLQDMQKLVRNVIERFSDWHRAIKRIFDSLVLRQGKESDASSLYVVSQYRLKGTLEERMLRAAKNPSALISFDEEGPDKGMMGYRNYLKSTLSNLAPTLLADSRWEAGIGKNNAPEIRLVVKGEKQFAYTVDTIRSIHQDLHDYFKVDIDRKFENTDIFDFLLYVQRQYGIQPEKMAEELSNSCQPLINARGATEEWKLLYKEPKGDDNKKNLAEAIQAGLQRMNQGGTKDPERSHSDRNSVTLLKVQKPSLDQIDDLRKCREKYDQLITEPLNGVKKHDDEVYRAQVFHPFRQELEAWYIERSTFTRRRMRTSDNRLHVRIVRLLEDPAMIQAFVQCVATGAIEKIKDKGWVWHSRPDNPNRDVWLTDQADPKADVMRAAVVFALQKREGKKYGMTRITLEDAKQSITEMAQKKGKTKREIFDRFRTNGLNRFLDENLAQENNPNEYASIREGLKMVFEFYSDTDMRTELQHRMDLPAEPSVAH